MKRPSALIEGCRLEPFPWIPALSTLTRSVRRVCRSWTNTSSRPLVSPGTRLEAYDSKATRRPSALSDVGVKYGQQFQQLKPSATWLPALSTLTRSVVPGREPAVEATEKAIG